MKKPSNNKRGSSIEAPGAGSVAWVAKGNKIIFGLVYLCPSAASCVRERLVRPTTRELQDGTSDNSSGLRPLFIRPSGASENRLAIQPITSQAHTTNYLPFVRSFGLELTTRRCLLLVSNQTLLGREGVILLLVVNLKDLPLNQPRNPPELKKSEIKKAGLKKAGLTGLGLASNKQGRGFLIPVWRPVD